MSLRNWNEIDKANIRNVEVPLGIDQIKEFFENKNLFFLVNYGKSKIKGNMFLTYLSNLDLPFEIVFEGVGKQEKFELLKIYLETRNQSNSDVLRLTMADILLSSRSVPHENWINNPILTPEECEEFIVLNKPMIDKWNIFLSSHMVFIIKCFPKMDEKIKSSETFPHIKDPAFIGGNCVMLFDILGFLELYFSVPYEGPLFYFDSQFDEPMFKGKNLFHYFSCPENTILACANGVLNQTITKEAFVTFMSTEI